MRFRVLTAAAGVLAATLAWPTCASAQDLADRFTIHGSLIAGIGKANGTQYYGIDTTGTSNYRAVVLQFGYKLADDDRVVVQLLNRRLGLSPLQAVEPDIAPIWAFYEHRNGDLAVKVGRSPLPRGLFNETRFIGTLLPFYRVGKDVYGETLEYIDGVVVSHRSALGSWGVDASLFGGGFDLKTLSPNPTGVNVYQDRGEQSIGASVIVRTPIEGLRFGAYAHDYKATLQRGETFMYSADGDFKHFWLRSEYTAFRRHSNSFDDLHAYYVQGGIKVTDKINLAAEHGDANVNVSFAGTPFPDADLPYSSYNGFAVNYSPQSSVRFKVEWNHQYGYIFDKPVPSFIPPRAPPLVMGLAPKTQSNAVIASIAVSF